MSSVKADIASGLAAKSMGASKQQSRLGPGTGPGAQASSQIANPMHPGYDIFGTPMAQAEQPDDGSDASTPSASNPNAATPNDPFAQAQSAVTGAKNAAANAPAPAAAAAPSAAEQLRDSQIQQAKDFRAGLPGMQAQMANGLTQASNQQLGSNIKQVQTTNSSRGLGYGGVNEGMKAQTTNTAKAALGQGIQNANQGLLSAANQMDADAIQTGVGIQGTNQAIQNQIYQRAMADQQSANSQSASIMAPLITYGLLAATL